MSYTASYRKWRPMVFEDVVGQPHITETLKHQIISNRIAHAYLFCGTRGTGKTTSAKIFSRAVNCLNPTDGNPCNECEICKGILNGSILDVIEIDAASNNGVENIREIRDEVMYSPTRAKYKVYIIDEVHMLSTGAFNALLKTLEEPPPYVIFILATTELRKVPATILSRCQKYDVKRISINNIVKRLIEITEKENIIIDKYSIMLIARSADGSMRDALSILDQAVAFSKDSIKYEELVEVLGISDNLMLFDMTSAISKKDSPKIIELINKLIIDGKDITQFIIDFIGYFRNLMMCKVLDNPYDILEMTKEDISALKEQSNNFTNEQLINYIRVLNEAQNSAKWSSQPRIILEATMLKISSGYLDNSMDSILSKISDLENQIKSGAIKVNAISSDNVKDNANIPTEKQVIKREKPQDPDIKEACTKWKKIIEAIKKELSPSIAGNLVDTNAQAIDNYLAIIFPNDRATNKLLVSRVTSLQGIEDIIAKMTGKDIKVKCLLEKEIKDEDIYESYSIEQDLKLRDTFGDMLEIQE